jgi:hypothetical protein
MVLKKIRLIIRSGPIGIARGLTIPLFAYHRMHASRVRRLGTCQGSPHSTFREEDSSPPSQTSQEEEMGVIHDRFCC